MLFSWEALRGNATVVLVTRVLENGLTSGNILQSCISSGKYSLFITILRYTSLFFRRLLFIIE